MARPLRIYFEGAWYHVMNRGVNHGQIFFNDAHRYAFLDLLGKTKEIYGIEIHAYCLMGNHYHLILHTPRGNISQAMKYLNASYAQLVNFSIKRDGPLFKGRFMAIVISADDYLVQLSRYIHLNPLKAEIVSSVSDYKWSSYLAYIGKDKPQDWLSRTEIMNRFGLKSFREKYTKFMELDADCDINKFYEDKPKPVIGDDDFCQMVDSYIKSHSLSAEIVGAKKIASTPSIQEIIKVVSQYFKVDPMTMFEANIKSGNFPRQIAIYICRKLGGYSLREIANSFGSIGYKGISKAIGRVSRNELQLKEANNLLIRITDGCRRDATPRTLISPI